MTDLSSSLIWLTIQVTLFSLAGMAIYTIARRFGPTFGAMVTLACLLIITMLGLCALSPWPNWVPPSVAIQENPNSLDRELPPGSETLHTPVDKRASDIIKNPGPADAVSSGAPNNLAPAAPLSAEDLPATIESNPEEAGLDRESNPVENGGSATQNNPSDSPADAQTGFVPSDSPSESSSALRQVMASLWEELKKAPAPPVETTVVESTSWSWREILACVFLAGVGLGILRTAGGLIAVRGHCRRSRKLTDSDLLDTVDVLRARLGCSRKVALRESAALPSAATVGWLRPIILLPRQWREWTPIQRQTVLAHELVHISRNDFCARVLSQFGVMLQFYHPLVHWLSGKLRLEQELAADATAAELVGGRSVYLTSLAELALKQPNIRLGWPAQTFLPTRGMFLRRIEMLRNTKVRVEGTKRGLLSKLVQGAAICALLVAGVGVAGLRGASEVKLAVESQGIDISDQDLESIAEDSDKGTNNNQNIEESTNSIIWDEPRDGWQVGAKLLSASNKLQPGDAVMVQFLLKNVTDHSRTIVLQDYRSISPMLVFSKLITLNITGESKNRRRYVIAPGEVLENRNYRATLNTQGMLPGKYTLYSNSIFWQPSKESANSASSIGRLSMLPFTLGDPQSVTYSKPPVEQDPKKKIYWGNQVGGLMVGMRLPEGRKRWSNESRIEAEMFIRNASDHQIPFQYHVPAQGEWQKGVQTGDIGLVPLDYVRYSGFRPRITRKLDLKPGEQAQLTGVLARGDQEAIDQNLNAPHGNEIAGPTIQIQPNKTAIGKGHYAKLITQEGNYSWTSFVKVNQPAVPDLTMQIASGNVPFEVFAANVDADENKEGSAQGKVQFRLAESEPGEGLVKAKNKVDDKTVYLHPEVIVDESHIVSARIARDRNGKQAITFALNEAGARRMRSATSKNLPDSTTGEVKLMAIVVEGKVISAPAIRSEISKDCQMTGDLDEAEWKRTLKLLTTEKAKTTEEGAIRNTSKAPERNTGADSTRFRFPYVPKDVTLVASIKAGEILGDSRYQPLVKELTKSLPLWVKADEIEEFTWAVNVQSIDAPANSNVPNLRLQPNVRTVLHLNRDFDGSACLKATPNMTRQEHRGQVYYSTDKKAQTTALWAPDKRTVVIQDTKALLKLIDSVLDGQFEKMPDYNLSSPAQGLLVVNDLSPFQDSTMNQLLGGPLLQMIDPAIQTTDRAVVRFEVLDRVGLTASFQCETPGGAQQVEDILTGGRTLLKNLIDHQRDGMRLMEDKQQAAWIGGILSLTSDMLANSHVERRGKNVKLESKPRITPKTVSKLSLDALRGIQVQTKREQNRTNLRKLALGLLTHEFTHKCYPPPVLYGPDGKTPYSWRVAILPYIGEKDLYDQYRFDEPWDGPNNKKLLDKMPAVFRSPYDLPNSTFTSYFLLVGPETAFSQQKGHDNRGMRIADITDGTSNTLMLVESKHLGFELKDKEIEGRDGLRVSGEFNVQIPWTKPTDIPYAADKPLQELGGWTKGKFAVAFCDGSVALFDQGIENDLLKSLISRNGAEVIDRKQLPPHRNPGIEYREFNDKTGRFESRKAATEMTPTDIPEPAPKKLPSKPKETKEDQTQLKSDKNRANLKAIALGMLNYESTHKCYPPPVLYGPDGKTPYSWRVAILPFIGEMALYERYKFDEPWDGPNNKKLLGKMPEVFRSPYDEPNSTNTSYYVLTGPDTAFPMQKGRDNLGTRIADITDGTSQTLMVVEAKGRYFGGSKNNIGGNNNATLTVGPRVTRSRWTKPIDIPYAPDKPLQTLGGWTDGKFAVAFCDGSVKSLPNTMSKNMLSALATRAGTELVPQETVYDLDRRLESPPRDWQAPSVELNVIPPDKEGTIPRSEPLFENLNPE